MDRFEISVRTAEQLNAVLSCAGNIKRCYVSAEMLIPALSDTFQNPSESVARLLRELDANGVELYAALPYMTREEEGAPDIQDLKLLCDLAGEDCLTAGSQNSNMQSVSIKGMMVRNLEQLSFLAEHDYPGKIVLDAQIYMWNAQSIQELSEDDRLAGHIEGYTLPLEESVHSWRDTLAADRSGLIPTVILYGRVPMMVSAGCVLKTTRGCSGHKGRFDCERPEMEDRTGRKLPVECSCRYCYNVIWNAYPLSLHKAYFGGMHLGNISYRLDLTTETEKEALQTADFFCNGTGDAGQPPYTAYTTGRFQKGVD